MSDETTNPFGEVIFSYTRADAIRESARDFKRQAIGLRRTADGDHAADERLRGARHDGVERLARRDHSVKMDMGIGQHDH